MIIDFHTHIFSKSVLNQPEKYKSDKNFARIFSGTVSPAIDHTALLEYLNINKIDAAVALGFAWTREKFCEEQNIYFSEVAKSSRGKILPFGSVPITKKTDYGKWAKQIKEAGLAGIGEVAFYADGLGASNADILRGILSASIESALPVCLHVNEPVGHDYNGKYHTDFNVLYSILKEFKQATVILSHWGGGFLFYELMPEVSADLTNVYYDTAATPFLYKNDIYNIALKIAGAGRILLGTDYPLIKFNKYKEAVEKNVADKTDKKKIMGLNAAKLLKL